MSGSNGLVFYRIDIYLRGSQASQANADARSDGFASTPHRKRACLNLQLRASRQSTGTIQQPMVSVVASECMESWPRSVACTCRVGRHSPFLPYRTAGRGCNAAPKASLLNVSTASSSTVRLFNDLVKFSSSSGVIEPSRAAFSSPSHV